MGVALSALGCVRQGRARSPQGNAAQQPLLSRKALLIGIRYGNARSLGQQRVDDTGEAPHNEVQKWRKILVQYFGYLEQDIICMMDTEECRERGLWPNRENIRNQLNALVDNIKPTDRRFLLIAAHGTQHPCTSDQTELDNHDEVMCSVEEDGSCLMIKDNELRSTLVDRVPRGASLRAVLELCNSGTLLDLPFRLEISENGRPSLSDAKLGAVDVEGDILCLSACEDAQNAYICRDDQGVEQGLITATIDSTLGTARGEITLPVIKLLSDLVIPVPAENPGPSSNPPQQTPMVTLGRRLNEEEILKLNFDP